MAPAYSTYKAAKCKIAINAFYQSLSCNGPYDVATDPNFWPLRTSCVWIQGEKVNYAGNRLYICDATSLNRLKGALSKVSLKHKGIAVPHVNLCNSVPTVQWFMFHENSIPSSDLCLVLSAKVWFLVSEDVYDLLNYVACLHNLVPSKATVALSTIDQKESACLSSELVASLTILIMHPGDLFVSVPVYPFPESIGIEASSAELQTGQEVYIVRDKENSVEELLSEAPPTLERHILINKIPDLFQNLIDRFNLPLSTVPTDILEEHLLSQITLKEEPLHCMEDDVNETASSEDQRGMKVGLDSEHQPPVNSDRKERIFKVKRNSMARLSGTLLQCPKCTTSFKVGFHGRGLSRLMGHIHCRHKRLLSHCTSIIKRKYASIIGACKPVKKCLPHSKAYDAFTPSMER